MSWLPKRDKLDPVQASEYPPAVRPLASIRRGEAELPKAGASAVQVARYNGNNSFQAVAQEGKKKVEKVGGGGDAVAGTGKSVVLAHVAAKLALSVGHSVPV